MERLLTTTEVAELVRRPVATVRYWRTTGTGPPSARVRGRVLYRQADVETWLAEQWAADEHAGSAPSSSREAS